MVPGGGESVLDAKGASYSRIGLAELYDAPTKALNQAVRRNLDRFPEDFRVPPRRRRADGMEPATNCDRFPETP